MNPNQGMDPREQKRMLLAAELTFIESKASDFQERLSFARVLEGINKRQALLSTIEEKLNRARARGYRWGAELELNLASAKQSARGAIEKANNESANAGRSLAQRVQSVGRDVRRVAGGDALRNESAIQSLAQEVRAVDSAIDGAEKRIQALAEPFTRVVDELDRKLDATHWTLDQFETASFKQQPEENPLGAFKATWEDSPTGKQEGMLFLTDLRLRFEGQEEVVLERTFLIFKSRSEMRKKLMLDVLVGSIAGSEDSERGLLIKDQLLTLSFRPAPNTPQRATFELDDVGGKSVDTLIEQLRAGDLARSRYNGPMPEGSNVGVPVRWPTECQNCGAELVPPLKGQNIITCEYCKSNHEVTLGRG